MPRANPSPTHRPADLPTNRPAAPTGSAGPDAPVPCAGREQAATDAPRETRDKQLAAWLVAAAAGDARAFEAFYEGTFAYARTVARRLLRGDAEVEDLLADCYFEAWRHAARFDAARGSAVTWLLTLVRSRGLDALRAAAAHTRAAAGAGADPRATARTTANAGASAPASPEASSTALAAEPAAPEAEGPAEQLWRRQSGDELHAALGTLSAPERWVLGLAYLRGLSHTEIARCTGMPLGTVKSHALRAQAKLRERLAHQPAHPAAAPRTPS